MRIIFSITLLIIILSAPAWVYLPLIFLGIVLFPMYLEAIVLGVVIDMAYGGTQSIFFTKFAFGIGIALLVYLFAPIRSYLRFSN